MALSPFTQLRPSLMPAAHLPALQIGQVWIMVTQVLKQVAKGMPWDAITAEWRGTVTKDAIAEAVELAQRIFEDHAVEYAQESLTA